MRGMRSATAVPGSSSITCWNRICSRRAGPTARGIVHHCAFQVADRSVQDRVKANLEGLGFTDTSERKDRGYFESIYVRTPSGAMFEATVSKPDAFLIDEPYEKMGQTVQLAPQFESQRAVILESLEALNY